MNAGLYAELSAPCRCVYPERCFCTPAQKEAAMAERHGENVEVTSCFDCPFYSTDSETPVAYCADLEIGGTFSGMPVRGLDAPRVHDDCRLRGGRTIRVHYTVRLRR